MGQDVQINETVEMGDILIVDTDRSFTGQDGQALVPGSEGHGVPAVLAERLFALGLDIDHVHVLQNTITVRRPGGWDEDSTGSVTAVANTLLRYYDEEE